MNAGDVRTIVLGLLSRLYVPVSAEDFSLYAQVTSEVFVPEEVLTEIVIHDRVAFTVGEDLGVWICPALECPSGKPDFDYLTTSDWPVRSRLIDGNGVSEAQELMFLRHLCDVAAGGC